MTTIDSLGIFNSFMPSAPPSGVNFRGVQTGFPLQTNPMQREDRYTSDFTNIEFNNKKNIEKLAKSNHRVMEIMSEMQELMRE